MNRMYYLHIYNPGTVEMGVFVDHQDYYGSPDTVAARVLQIVQANQDVVIVFENQRTAPVIARKAHLDSVGPEQFLRELNRNLTPSG